MIEQLEELVDALDIPVDGDALREVLALRDQLDAKIADAVARFDNVGLWDADAATSMTAWLADRCRMSRSDADRCARRAKRMAPARDPRRVGEW